MPLIIEICLSVGLCLLLLEDSWRIHQLTPNQAKRMWSVCFQTLGRTWTWPRDKGTQGGYCWPRMRSMVRGRKLQGLLNNQPLPLRHQSTPHNHLFQSMKKISFAMPSTPSTICRGQRWLVWKPPKKKLKFINRYPRPLAISPSKITHKKRARIRGIEGDGKRPTTRAKKSSEFTSEKKVGRGRFIN